MQISLKVLLKTYEVSDLKQAADMTPQNTLTQKKSNIDLYFFPLTEFTMQKFPVF
jgi:hypothetical protein